MILESLILAQLATPCAANDRECQALFNDRIVSIPMPQLQPACPDGYKWQFVPEIIPPNPRAVYRAKCVPK